VGMRAGSGAALHSARKSCDRRFFMAYQVLM
jgi:hypothetical protein